MQVQFKSPISNNYYNSNYVKNNYSWNMHFKSEPTQNKTENKISKTNKIFIGLGTLALVAIAGLSYKKFHTTKAIKNSNNSLIKNLPSSLQKYINNFSSGISDAEQYNFLEEFKSIDFSEYKLANYLQKDEEAIVNLKSLVAAQKAKINLPSFLSIGNVLPSKVKEVSNVISLITDSNVISTKYTKGYMKEFIESLGEFASHSLSKYNEEQTHIFLHLKNPSEFLEDLNIKGNEECKLKFNNLIKENSKNKITYLIDSKASKELNQNSILTLNFDEKINTADLAEDLNDYEFKLDSKIMPKASNISNELFEYVQPNQKTFYWLRNLMLDKPTENIIFIEGKDKINIEKVINLISSRTANVADKIDCIVSSKDLLPSIIKKGVKAEELYNRTGKRTFLYLDDIEQSLNSNINKNSSEYKDFREFIENCSEKNHIIPVINTGDTKNIFETTLQSDKIFKMKLFADGEKIFQDSLEFMQDNMRKNDFSHIDGERFKREFINLLAAERAGKLGATAAIRNGILLHGSEEGTRITADAIRNTVDANYLKIPFNKNKPSDIIDKMLDEADSAEKSFQANGKRTILEMDKLDELLTNYKNNTEKEDLIAEFKSVAETLSNSYHTTLLVRTNKSLDNFESATIASHRLGMHIEVK